MEYGPTLAFSQALHAEKYRQPGESFEAAMQRVAEPLSDSPQHRASFLDALLNMRFLPAGRIQAAIGAAKNVTPYNCFVSGTIADSFVSGPDNIMQRATEAATTMRMGGGIGYDFSTLRPRGDLIKKLQSQSSGPVSFMSIFDAIGRCVSSSGHRRGAQMGVMRIDHPSIEEFVRAKQPPEEAQIILEKMGELDPSSDEWQRYYQVLQVVYPLTGFNISVGVSDKFMWALGEGKPFPLTFEGRVYKEIDPAELWALIMESTWDWAEPGVLFIDTINRMNNLWYCETIAATNPCGEQPLPPHGACLLGSFNLVKYLSQYRHQWTFDFDQLKADICAVVRAMDNVIDIATYPLFAQEREARSKRRMGLGVTGLANAIEAMGHPYGSPKFLSLEAGILDFIRDEAYLESTRLAEQKGSFPLYDAVLYAKGEFFKTLRPDVQEAIIKHGIRNSHLTSLAPTGTISACADNVSSCIEPVFAYEQKRIVNLPTGPVEVQLPDYGYRVFGVKGLRTSEVTLEAHLNVLSTAAIRVDSAVSKTCNVPADTPKDVFQRLYFEAWSRGCKGLTTYQVGGKRAGIIKSADDQHQACWIDPETGQRSCE